MLASASAQDPVSADEKVVVQTAEQALAKDAASVAGDQGIAAGEAARRLRIRLEADERLAGIRSGLAARYAGGYIVHSPRFGVVMRLTGAEAVAPQTLSLPSGELEVRFETGAGATLETLARVISDKLPALRPRFRRCRARALTSAPARSCSRPRPWAPRRRPFSPATPS